jgi:3-deoxy-D-manno-octulosonic-acid transferase
MRHLYTVLTWCVAPFAFAVVLWRGLRERAYWLGLRERFGFGGALRSAALDDARSIWLHAVSLGEMSAAAPLLQALRQRYPRAPLVLTTATPAGRARASALFGEHADIRFLPYDTPGSVRRFLKRIRPGICIIMETELWPNLLHACARRDIPVVLASARLTAKSVARYQRMGGLFRSVFTRNVLVAAQNKDEAARFVEIGAAAAQVSVVGNVKFDMHFDAQTTEQGLRLRLVFGSERFAWVAGSTHPGEDEAVLSAHKRLLTNNPRALLLLAPRHRDRFASVAALLKSSGLRYQLRSESGTDAVVLAVALAEAQVLLVDSLGELASMYAAADVAFVGGSLAPIGGHNLLEPAALGLPVLSGPYQANNKEVAALLFSSGAAAQVKNPAELGAALLRLSGDEIARKRMGEAGVRIVAANRGSVAALVQIMEPLLAASAGYR